MTIPVTDQPALTGCADWCCTKGCVGHANINGGLPTELLAAAPPVLTTTRECARVCTCGGRDTARLHTLVQHYERHLTATGREWVINEAHKRTETPRD